MKRTKKDLIRTRQWPTVSSSLHIHRSLCPLCLCGSFVFRSSFLVPRTLRFFVVQIAAFSFSPARCVIMGRASRAELGNAHPGAEGRIMKLASRHVASRHRDRLLGARPRRRALEAQGREIIHLEIGEPDFDTPAHIVEAGVKALRDRADALRPGGRVSRSCARRSPARSRRSRGIDVDPAQVVVTPGGKPIMFFVILALVRRGRRGHLSRIPASRSTSRWSTSSAATVSCRCGQEKRASASTSTSSRRASTPRTKLVIINSPANPTGGVLDRDRHRGARRHPARAARLS